MIFLLFAICMYSKNVMFSKNSSLFLLLLYFFMVVCFFVSSSNFSIVKYLSFNNHISLIIFLSCDSIFIILSLWINGKICHCVIYLKRSLFVKVMYADIIIIMFIIMSGILTQCLYG